VRRSVAVYGAYGHTGRFVVAELQRRGFGSILLGRDESRLGELSAKHRGTTVRTASIDDPDALDSALRQAKAVINCAGPFASTAGPVIEAAIRAGIHYLDVAAEIEANLDTFSTYGGPARNAGITIIPAMAFFGGLGDLLATAAIGEWQSADEIMIAYGLDSWHPTSGTRTSGKVSRQRRNGRRIVYSNGGLEYRDGPAATGEWIFPEPFGKQPVMSEFTMADSVTIPRHIKTPELRSYMSMAAVKDVTDLDTPPPVAIDDSNRSPQRFVVEVVARLGRETRRAAAGGRDIYAVSAPLVVEATQRLINRPEPRPGVFSAGEFFDARDFLAALSPEFLNLC
jgi:NAD(P)-dependent dehydrogenase (short-subunit alcohol dehydrogenase family)